MTTNPETIYAQVTIRSPERGSYSVKPMNDAPNVLYVRNDIHRARIEALEAALRDARSMLEGEPEYHHQGMGCGLEDRCIKDRYEAMQYGWDQAMERVYGEHINHAKDLIDTALTGAKP